MARVPVKLTRGEIVLPPSVARRYRQRLEEMNAMGLQARAMGGVVAYRQAGGIMPVGSPGEPATAADLYEGDYQEPDQGVDPFATQQDPEVTEMVIKLADKFGLRITDQIGYVLETVVRDWMSLSPEKQEEYGSIEEVARYVLEEEDLLKYAEKDNFAGGGLVAYRQDGGSTQKFLGHDVPTGSVGKVGASLVAIGQRDFKGASAALAGPTGGDEETKDPSITNQMIKLLVEANPHLR